MAHDRIHNERLRTSLQTGLLVLLLAGLAVAAAWGVLGAWSLLAGGVLLAFVPLSMRRTSLPRRIAGARMLTPENAPHLAQMVDLLSDRAGLKRPPRLYLVSSPLPNAATIGSREDAAIMLSRDLLDGLDARELAGVLAHEIGHIRNNDLGLFRLTEVLRQTSVFASQFGWLMVLFALPLAVLGVGGIAPLTILILLAAPLGASLLQLAVSRSREFAADLAAVQLTGDPSALASALRKIEGTNRWLLRSILPFPQPESSGLLRTHPDTGERVRRLRELAYA
jgi:heat shock protein HtpX